MPPLVAAAVTGAPPLPRPDGRVAPSPPLSRGVPPLLGGRWPPPSSLSGAAAPSLTAGGWGSAATSGAPVGLALHVRGVSTSPPNPPQAAADAATDPNTRHHYERRLVPFSPDAIQAIVADVGSYSAFVPWCTASTVTAVHADDGAGRRRLSADLGIGFRLLSETYTSDVEVRPGAVRAVVPRNALFEFLVNEWTFEAVPRSPGAAWVGFGVRFAFRNPLYQRVTDLFFDEVVRKMVAAFERRAADVARRDGRGGKAGGDDLIRW